MRIICWARTIWYTVTRWFNAGFDGILVSGHLYQEVDGMMRATLVEPTPAGSVIYADAVNDMKPFFQCMTCGFEDEN